MFLVKIRSELNYFYRSADQQIDDLCPNDDHELVDTVFFPGDVAACYPMSK